MSNLRKIIAWIFVFAIIIYGLFVPAFASVNPDPTDSRGNFYDWAVNQGGSFSGGRPDDSIGGGRYSKDHYDDFVSELPATGITSGGHIIWQPTLDSLFGTGDIYTNSTSGRFSSNSAPGYWGSNSRLYVEKGIDCIQFSFLENANVTSFLFQFHIIFPISGYYRVLPGKAILFRVVSDSGDIINTEYNYTLGTSFRHCDVGVYETPFVGGVTNTSSSGFRAWAYFPRYEIIPDTALDTSAGSQYSVTTRPTSITGGNYGIVGDNGTINTVTNNNQIINETNNTYYNPATGTTAPIIEWSYDYSDRSYNVTVEGGDTYNVTYGDENITIIFDEVPKLFGGFLDFLGVVFPYIPSEITLLLTFGIVAVTFIGIIKAIRR